MPLNEFDSFVCLCVLSINWCVCPYLVFVSQFCWPIRFESVGKT